MNRFADWETRLTAYLEPLRERQFAWGEMDCAIFAADAVKAMTGVDPIPDFRGSYTDAASAKEALRIHGAGTLIRTMDGMFERIPVGFAHRGDIVMVRGNLGISMGAVSIHIGAQGERDGLIRHNRADWSRAWVAPMPVAANG